MINLDGTRTELPGPPESRVRLPLLAVNMHQHLHRSWFACLGDIRLAALSAAFNAIEHLTPYKLVKSTMDIVHKHVWGHAKFSNTQTLLEKNNMCSPDAAKYLSSQVAGYRSYQAASKQKPSRKVFLASLSRIFNDLICLDHFFLDEIRLFHAMDAFAAYSAGVTCKNISLASTAHDSGAIWLSQLSLASTAHNFESIWLSKF